MRLLFCLLLLEKLLRTYVQDVDVIDPHFFDGTILLWRTLLLTAVTLLYFFFLTFGRYMFDLCGHLVLRLALVFYDLANIFSNLVLRFHGFVLFCLGRALPLTVTPLVDHNMWMFPISFLGIRMLVRVGHVIAARVPIYHAANIVQLVLRFHFR